jgi:hypothetical protein
VTLESWLIAYGDIVWKFLLLGFVALGAALPRLRARRRAQQRERALLASLHAPQVRAPDLDALAPAGQRVRVVIVHGTLQARQPGQVASTLWLTRGEPLLHEQRGQLALRMRPGAPAVPIVGAVEVLAGSTRARADIAGSDALERLHLAHGDPVAAYGVLERVPGAGFGGYRQDAGAWRLRSAPGDERVRLFFTGTPRTPWLHRGVLGATLMGLFFLATSSLVGYVAVTDPWFRVRCDHFYVPTPTVSAVASATPVFRAWGLRRYAMYAPCVGATPVEELPQVSRR